MKELTLETDDFGKPMLHSKKNSFILQVYSLLINSEGGAYPNQAIGIGILDLIYTTMTSDELSDLSAKLMDVLSRTIPTTVIETLNIAVKASETTHRKMIVVSMEFSFIEDSTEVTAQAAYQFTTNSEDKLVTHIFT